MIEMYLLEQLVAVEKFGRLSEAAKNLYISQPALSRSMQKLERLLDVELFSRSKKSNRAERERQARRNFRAKNFESAERNDSRRPRI